MTTREEFRGLVTAFGEACSAGHSGATRATCDALRDAWDEQAAQVERLRAEVEAERDALRTGVPLTAENAPRASLVGYKGMILEQHEFLPGKFGWALQVGFRPGVDPYAPAEFLVARGATVLAWRRP